jgi:hypothetical protein
MRKLCTDEVGGFKMKQNETKTHFPVRKKVFSLLLCLAAHLALHFKMIWRA